MSSPAVQTRFLFEWKQSEYLIMSSCYNRGVLKRIVSLKGHGLDKLESIICQPDLKHPNHLASSGDQYFPLRTYIHILDNPIPSLDPDYRLSVRYVMLIDQLKNKTKNSTI